MVSVVSQSFSKIRVSSSSGLKLPSQCLYFNSTHVSFCSAFARSVCNMWHLEGEIRYRYLTPTKTKGFLQMPVCYSPSQAGWFVLPGYLNENMLFTHGCAAVPDHMALILSWSMIGCLHHTNGSGFIFVVVVVLVWVFLPFSWPP